MLDIQQNSGNLQPECQFEGLKDFIYYFVIFWSFEHIGIEIRVARANGGPLTQSHPAKVAHSTLLTV